MLTGVSKRVAIDFYYSHFKFYIEQKFIDSNEKGE